MKCQSLFSGEKIRKYDKFVTAELAKGVVMVKNPVLFGMSTPDIHCAKEDPTSVQTISDRQKIYSTQWL